MNLLQKASEFLADQRQKFLTVDLLYNGDLIQATTGKTMFKINTSFGVLNIESTDFLINVSALSEIPKKGDKIEFLDDTFEVLAPDNEPIFRYTDNFKTTYRVHSKKVSKTR